MGVHTSMELVYGVVLPTEMYDDNYEEPSPIVNFLREKLEMSLEEIEEEGGVSEMMYEWLNKNHPRDFELLWCGDTNWGQSEMTCILGLKGKYLGGQESPIKVAELQRLRLESSEALKMLKLLAQLREYGIELEEPEWLIVVSTG